MERLDKLISNRCGVSRSGAKDLIKAGAVMVNGVPASSPEQKCGEADTVSVNGKPVDTEKHVYYMLNKPQGVLSASRDKNAQTVLDLLPRELRRKGLFPAGRLDKDTEGFVLITDDGGFAHRILSPKNHVPKRYYVVVGGHIPADLPVGFKNGVELGGGDITGPAELTVIKDGEKAEAELTIYEGMYHQVKRMFLKYSLEVLYLKRLSIGGLELDAGLAPGECRRLSHSEMEMIACDSVEN